MTKRLLPQLASFLLAAVFTASPILGQTAPAPSPASVPAPSSTSAADADKVILEQMVVTDTTEKPFTVSTDIDLPRSQNDIQPYYIWTSSDIDASGSVDLNDFFSRMVPMDATSMSNAQTSDQVLGNVSNINLGGLNSSVSGFGYNNGTQNTLILLNGHRLPSMGYETQNIQADISGIPLSAIDRIEVLQASASAIYGSSAAGGVVNVVMKQNYAGAELRGTYDNTFDSDAPIRTESLSAGFNLFGGKTNVFLSATYTTTKPLEVQDRLGLVDEYEARYFAGYPGGEAAYVGASAATGYFSQPLIISSNSTPLIKGTTATVIQVPAGYQSALVNGLTPLQNNVGLFDFTHPNDSTYRTLTGLKYYLMQAPEQKSFYANVRQEISSWLSAYGSLLVTTNFVEQPRESFDIDLVTVAATNPYNPFGQAVKVTGVQDSDPAQESTNRVTQTATGGFVAKLPHSWNADLDFTWAQSRLNLFNPGFDSTAFDAAVASGTVNIITDLGKYPVPKSSYYPEWATAASGATEGDVDVRAVGPLMNLWAGAPQLSGSLEHYRVGNITGLNITDTPLEPQNEEFVYYPGQSSQDTGEAAELTFPLISALNRVFAVRDLELQAAVRGDQYSNTVNSPASEEALIKGSAVTYTPGGTAPQPPVSAKATYDSVNEVVGMKWTPIDDVTFRASYATGFSPPVYSQLIPPNETGDTYNVTGTPPAGVPTSGPWPYQQIIDPKLGNLAYYVPVASGGNPNLKPETSENIGYGVIVTPKFLPGFRASVDYAQITKHSNIIAPSAQLLVSNESSFAGLITRAAPTAGSGYSVGPVTLIDAEDLNAVKSISSLYNVQADYGFKVRFGTLRVHAVGTFYQHYQVQATIASPLTEYLGNPDYLSPGDGFAQAKFKGNLGLTWNSGPWTAGWLARYIGPYTVGSYYGIGGGEPIQGTVNGWVSGQIYHDINAGYSIPKGSLSDPLWKQFLRGYALTVGIKNLFNHAPPYDAVSGPAFPYWYSPYGSLRLAEYYVSLRKSF